MTEKISAMPENLPVNRPLWAPWRIEFIRGSKNCGCFLCSDHGCFAPQEEELIIARLQHVFIILNRFPYNSGHLLIAPYRHVGDITLLTEKERHELIDTVPKAIQLLQAAMRPDGFNTGFNLGVAAGAGVADHLHFHIVPRWVGDNNFIAVLGDTRVVPESLTATAEFLKNLPAMKEFLG